MPAATSSILGLAVTGFTTVSSAIQANKQQKLYRQAQADAEKYMKEAEGLLKMNMYDNLAIPKETYELQRDSLLSQGEMAIDAARESDRDTSATAGKVQMAMNEGQAGIRTAQAEEMFKIDKLRADEEARLRDIQVGLDTMKVQGANQAAADAQVARTAAMENIFSGLGSMAGHAAELVPLYMKTSAGKQYDSQVDAYNQAAFSGGLPKEYYRDGKPMTYQEALGVSNPDVAKMSPSQFQQYMGGLSKKQLSGMDPLQQQFNIMNWPAGDGMGTGVLLPEYQYQQPTGYDWESLYRPR